MTLATLADRTFTANNVRVLAPAKVNLLLAMGGTRADGYHNIVTLFERISLADEIFLAPHESEVTCRVVQSVADSHEAVPTDERNVAVRAVRAIQQACNISRGVALTIRKHIPVGAGLGGGSSDAAAVLRALNTWWDLRLSNATLWQMGRALGADVPCFLLEQPWSLGMGRGDVALPIPQATRRIWHVLVTPNTALATAAIYQGWDAVARAAQTPWATSHALIEQLLRDTPVATWSPWLVNDLAPIAEAHAPHIRAAKQCLRQAGARAVVMSGSGPTVVALADDETTAHAWATHAQRQQPRWCINVAHTASH